MSFADGNVDKAVTKPPYSEWLSRIRNRFVADVFPGAVVDLHVGLLDDVDQCDDSTARLDPAARQAHALEIEALALAGPQQPAILQTTDGACARRIRGQQHVLALRRQLVKRDVEVKI